MTSNAHLKSKIPWQAKIVAKIVLSRLPVSFATWRRLKLFQHGEMNTGDFALEIFRRHCERQMYPGALSGKTLLELGPGDGIATGLLAYCFGAERTYLVDNGDYVDRNFSSYKQMLEGWKAEGIATERLDGCKSFDELCHRSATVYLTRGLESIRSIPDGCVDVMFSNAVLEHIRRSEFDDTFRELRRVMKPGAAGSNQVDLRDHLGGALNNLRFSERLWESDFFSSSGFYTNRIRFSEMVARIERAGFEVDVTKTWLFDTIPTPRRRMAKPFRDLADQDLLVCGFDVALTPGPADGAGRSKHDSYQQRGDLDTTGGGSADE